MKAKNIQVSNKSGRIETIIYHAHYYNKGWYQHTPCYVTITDVFDIKMKIRDVIIHDWDYSIEKRKEKRNYTEEAVYIESLQNVGILR
jgi:hypothetical protein